MLAAIDGLKANTLGRYLRNERVPNPAMMARIERWTQGLVTRSDFLNPSPPQCVTIVRMSNGRLRWAFPFTTSDEALTEAADIEAERDPDARLPDHPLQRAIAVLGSRMVDAGRGGIFLLDGKATDARGIVRAANDDLELLGLELIHYPGVHPRWRR